MYRPGDNTNDLLIYKAQVVSVPKDRTGYSPIKCRIQIIDDPRKIPDDKDLADCFPLLPKHLWTYPLVGEYVYLLMLGSKSQQQIRYFLGPVIDIFKNLSGNPYDNLEPNASISSDLAKTPDEGIYPENDQISIQGRQNSDIVFKDQEVLLRAGKYVNNNPLKFNAQDTGYIQIRYGEPSTKKVKKNKKTNIVKLPTFDGEINANIANVTGVLFDWIVNINVYDKENKFIGRIYKSFTSEDGAVLFIKETFSDLKEKGSAAKSIPLIVNNFGVKTSITDFSNYKFVTPPIPQFSTFNVNPKTVTEVKNEVVEEEETVFDPDSRGSVINMVGDKINIISHANSSNFKLLDPLKTITAEEQLTINTQAQPIPLGYNLKEFLELIKSFVTNHTHAYHGLPPDPYITVLEISNYDLESILNQNVRTA